MKALPPPPVLLRELLHDSHAITVAAFAVAAIFLGIAGRLIFRNFHHNEPGLRAPLALPVAVLISAAGAFGADLLTAPWSLIVGVAIGAPSGLVFPRGSSPPCPRPGWKGRSPPVEIRPRPDRFPLPRDQANRHYYSPAMPITARLSALTEKQPRQTPSAFRKLAKLRRSRRRVVTERQRATYRDIKASR